MHISMHNNIMIPSTFLGLYSLSFQLGVTSYLQGTLRNGHHAPLSYKARVLRNKEIRVLHVAALSLLLIPDSQSLMGHIQARSPYYNKLSPSPILA